MRVPEEGNRYLTYRELGERLGAYAAEMGYTHVEFMPITEHPFYGSWGYQPIGLYAPTRRYGAPQDFMACVDALHRYGVGVILDWVPAHFPNDPHGLTYFDGTHLYEHEDPRRREHPEWGTRIFNYGRNEVANYLIGSALFWLDKYHIDGLRLDAVASMLYLDYGRQGGDWLPNQYGGRENLEAVSFLRRLNEAVYREHPGALTIAEESTAWPQVSRPTYVGGLGFGFKWNMGWMHDLLDYMAEDPVHRKYHHNHLTFGFLYAWSENFILPLSHDEVVYGKGSLHRKMPGDDWQKFANLRAFFGFMYGHPGKKLLFMGGEFGQTNEWNHEASLDWHLLEMGPYHRGLQRLVQDLNGLYRTQPALYQVDFSSEGFQWMDCDDCGRERDLVRPARARPAGLPPLRVQLHARGAERLPGRRSARRFLPRADQHGRRDLRREQRRERRKRSGGAHPDPRPAAIRSRSTCRPWRPWCCDPMESGEPDTLGRVSYTPCPANLMTNEQCPMRSSKDPTLCAVDAPCRIRAVIGHSIRSFRRIRESRSRMTRVSRLSRRHPFREEDRMRSDELAFMSASDLAALIRNKQVSPVEAVEAVLARIARLNPRLNAFCAVTADAARTEARAAEAAVAARGPARPAARRAVLGQRPGDYPGGPDGVRVAHLRGQHPDRGRPRRRATEGCRRDHGRQDDDAGVRMEGHHRLAAHRDQPESLGSDQIAGRLQRRRGRRGGGRLGAAGGRDGWRRLDSHPGKLLRRLRPEADLWRGAHLSDAEYRNALPCRPHDPDGAGRRPDAVGDGGAGRPGSAVVPDHGDRLHGRAGDGDPGVARGLEPDAGLCPRAPGGAGGDDPRGAALRGTGMPGGRGGAGLRRSRPDLGAALLWGHRRPPAGVPARLGEIASIRDWSR